MSRTEMNGGGNPFHSITHKLLSFRRNSKIPRWTKDKSSNHDLYAFAAPELPYGQHLWDRMLLRSINVAAAGANTIGGTFHNFGTETLSHRSHTTVVSRVHAVAAAIVTGD